LLARKEGKEKEEEAARARTRMKFCFFKQHTTSSFLPPYFSLFSSTAQEQVPQLQRENEQLKREKEEALHREEELQLLLQEAKQ
jgi:hypothetical protein